MALTKTADIVLMDAELVVQMVVVVAVAVTMPVAQPFVVVAVAAAVSLLVAEDHKTVLVVCVSGVPQTCVERH